MTPIDNTMLSCNRGSQQNNNEGQELDRCLETGPSALRPPASNYDSRIRTVPNAVEVLSDTSHQSNAQDMALTASSISQEAGCNPLTCNTNSGHSSSQEGSLPSEILLQNVFDRQSTTEAGSPHELNPFPSVFDQEIPNIAYTPQLNPFCGVFYQQSTAKAGSLQGLESAPDVFHQQAAGIGQQPNPIQEDVHQQLMMNPNYL